MRSRKFKIVLLALVLIFCFVGFACCDVLDGLVGDRGASDGSAGQEGTSNAGGQNGNNILIPNDGGNIALDIPSTDGQNNNNNNIPDLPDGGNNLPNLPNTGGQGENSGNQSGNGSTEQNGNNLPNTGGQSGNNNLPDNNAGGGNNLPDAGTSGQGENNGNNNAANDFIFQNCVGGVAMSGLTAAGRQKDVLTVPAEFNGKPVVKIMGYVFYNSVVKSVTLPESFVEIEARAFAWCESLESVKIYSGTIGENAFFWCTSLEQVDLGCVTGIGQSAFQGCSALEKISLPASIQTMDFYTFYYCTALKEVTFEPGFSFAEIPEYTFGYCSSLETIALPRSIKKVGNFAFSFCTKLREITAYDIEEASIAAFDYTAWINLPGVNNELYLGTMLYRYTGKFSGSAYTVKSGTFAIGEGAFSNQSFSSIILPESLEYINDYAFNLVPLQSIHLPKNVRRISGRSFQNSYSMSSITVDTRNPYFKVFDGVLFNRDMTELIMFPVNDYRGFYEVPDTVKLIGEMAFPDTKLSSIVLPEGLEYIGALAFIKANNLTSLIIPSSVKYIGSQVFDWSGISAIIMQGEPPEFDYCQSYQSRVLFVKPDFVEAYKNALPNFIICAQDELSDFLIKDGVLIKYLGSEQVVAVPSGVRVIGEYAFYGNHTVLYVILPEGVEEIERYAFSSTLIFCIELPQSLRIIRESAFHFAQWLQEITLPENIELVEGGAFRACFYLSGIYVEGGTGRYYSVDGILFDRQKKMLVCYPSGKQPMVFPIGITPELEYIVPEGIEIIDEYAFAYTAILNIVLPDGLKEIRAYAFQDCGFTESINIPDTVEKIGWGAFLYCHSISSIHIPKSVTDFSYTLFQGWTAEQTICFEHSKDEIPVHLLLDFDGEVVFDCGLPV